MIDQNRPVLEQLAVGVLDMLSRGWTRDQIDDHLLVSLADKSPLGPKWGRDILWWVVRWAMNGRPHLVVDHKLAASLVATEIPPDFADEVVPPWDQFMATVPAGLLQHQECSVLIDVNRTTRKARLIFYDRRVLGDGDGDSCLPWNICQPWSEYAIGDTDRMYAGAVEDGMARERRDGDPRRGAFVRSVSHFVFGCCAELHGRVSAPMGRARHDVTPRSAAEPQNWTIRLSRQVRVDAREYVRAYVAGEKRSIKVQYMRRGHWRNQPCGPRNSLRKFIHIEPHWVGPESAPIAVRSHRMDSKEGA